MGKAVTLLKGELTQDLDVKSSLMKGREERNKVHYQHAISKLRNPICFS